MTKSIWSINGRFLTQGVTGVQRYAIEIVRELDRLVAEDHPLTRDLDLQLVVPASARPFAGLAAIPTRALGFLDGHLWDQFTLPRGTPGNTLNLCNMAPLIGSRTIACIHDTNVLDYPASYSGAFRFAYGALMPRIARRAAALATVSRFSASRIARFGVDPERIAVLPNGHEHAVIWPDEASPRVAALSGQHTVVVLGSLAPHKNIRMLVGLSDRLAAHGLRRVVVGGLDQGVFMSNGGKAALPPDNLVFAGRLSDGELRHLLGSALCLAFPSFVEGFGLPMVEAFALGCPVVASDRASLPEVGGDAALYASPDAPEDWLAAFLSLKNNFELRDDLIERGHRQVRAFSWRRSALGYLELIQRLELEARERRLVSA